MPRRAGRRKRISAEVVVLKTVRFKFCIAGNSVFWDPVVTRAAKNCSQKTGCISLNAAFCRLVFFAPCGKRPTPTSPS